MSKKKIFNKGEFKKIGRNFFAKFFGFEVGIDITDDVAVLNRRNIVMKNIIFISNLFYSVLLLILSIATSKEGLKLDWAITLISFPVTYFINKLLNTLINLDSKDKTKQLIAMYVASFYIFLSSVLMYARFQTASDFETVSYILIYYAIVVISLYQDKKMLSTAFMYLFLIVTFIHFMWTYNISGSQATGLLDFFKSFVGTSKFGDLILRSLVFGLFYLVVYVIVSIGQYMQEERKKELIKRRQVQNDFSLIVGKLFQAVFFNAYVSVNQEHSQRVSKMSEKIASFVGMNSTNIENLKDYSLIHLRFDEIKDMKISDNVYDERTYETLKNKTTLGADIVNRLEISQNSEDIVRSIVENSISDYKMKAIMNAQPNLDTQVILLSDIYITLRGANSYKRPYPHTYTMDLFQKNIAPYFITELKERFIKFSDEVDDLYNSF